ncbi:hypothetical protein AAC387_Pa12g1897 [Persea americana]
MGSGEMLRHIHGERHKIHVNMMDHPDHALINLTWGILGLFISGFVLGMSLCRVPMVRFRSVKTPRMFIIDEGSFSFGLYRNVIEERHVTLMQVWRAWLLIGLSEKGKN